MTTILIVQTMILFLTACAAVWYTYETRLLRKEAELQRAAMAEQLRILTAEFEDKKKESHSFIKPIFTFTGGSWNPGTGTFQLTNQGEVASEIKVSGEPDIEGHLYPDVLGRGTQAKVTLNSKKQAISEDLKLTIQFKNKLGQHCRNEYRINLRTVQTELTKEEILS